MTTQTENAHVEISTLNVDVLNNPKLKVKTRFLALNMEDRYATVQVVYKVPNGKKWHVLTTSARLTYRLMKWFTDQRAVLDDDGQFTGEALTNFQRYLKKRELPIDTKLADMVFESENHSESYADNPFSLRFNKKNDYAVLELVNMPFHKPIVKVNPMTNESEIVKFVYPRRSDNGHVLTLPKTYYKRLIVK